MRLRSLPQPLGFPTLPKTPKTKSKRVVFRTPGRTCSHADQGCCPRCFDPMGRLKSTKEFQQKKHPKHYTSPKPTT
ncbi:hypothetical protein [Caudoviricetes sp.]|nr:hypothetical protein [Caudoviricetes sp.]